VSFDEPVTIERKSSRGPRGAIIIARAKLEEFAQ